MPMKTAGVAVVKSGKRKRRNRKMRRISKSAHRLPAMFGPMSEYVARAIEELLEKRGHSREGGVSMLRAWFGKGLLRRKKKKGKSGTYVGQKGRRYKVTKIGSKKYRITRQK